VVLRATGEKDLEAAYEALWTVIVENGFEAVRPETR
jgi:hypothetical protein